MNIWNLWESIICLRFIVRVCRSCNFRILGNTSSGSIVEIESGLYELCARSYLSGSAKAQSEVIADSSPQDNARQQRSKN